MDLDRAPSAGAASKAWASLRPGRAGILRTVRVEPINLQAPSALDLESWRELAARAIEPNPFFEPEYVLPLARGLGQQADVRLLVVRKGNEWRACLPVHSAARWHRIPLRTLSTWRGNVLYSVLGTPLISPDRPTESLLALLEGMRRAEPRARFAGLEWVAEDRALSEPLAEALEDLSPAPLLFERFERAALRRRPQPTYVEETLGSKRRRELKRQRRKLGEALDGEPRMVDRAGADTAYERFIDLESAGRKGQRGTVLGADPGHAAFFKEMCRGFAELGRLQMLELQGPDQAVAAKCNLLAGDTIFFFKIAYDEAWSSYSPGILLELDMLKFFHEESEANFMDSCADPNNAMINRLWPDRRPIATHAIPVGGLSGRAIRPALAAARFARDRKRERKDT
jgi:CelD/BcsL family acetyltransferase involved in cellulose biosynthesis